MSHPFVHLHNHSHYSLGDAISQIPEIFKMANQYNMPAVSITDHGNMFAVAEFLLEAKKYPHINAIVGSEIYLTHYAMDSRQKVSNIKPYYHLVLLVKNEKGYQNLSKMVSLSYEKGFYYRPRIDFPLLEKHSEGLIASSACLSGEIASLLLKGNFAEAEKRALYFQDLFGKDHFFLELMDHHIPEQVIVNQELLKLAKKTGIALIATNDVHYPHQKDAQAHDVFLCIASGNKKASDKRKRYSSEEFYFKQYEEMQEVIGKWSLEALHNTVYVAEKCQYNPNFEDIKLPSFETSNHLSAQEFLRKQCFDHLEIKYPHREDAKNRLEYELHTIESMGFSSYFLIVQDFIQYAKQQNIAVGPGRGSVAGSIVAYLLGITALDPLQYDLLFERFLNPGRISMPDIDTDFDDTKRDEVIRYVTQKYGADKVSQIVTFGRLKAKMVLRDVGRVLDISLPEIDSLTKMLPNLISLEKAYQSIPEFKNKIESSTVLQELFQYSQRLENLIRHTSVHAAGIIIGKTALSETIPLYKDNKTGIIVTQFEGKYLEEFGFLKMDFLGLRNLRIIQTTLNLIKKNHQKEIDIESLPLDDEKTYKIYQEGKGIGVFQCESSGIIELMKQMHPSRFADIVALLALYRPGPLNSGMAETFVKNKKSPKEIVLFHKDLEAVLKDTYGVIVYQEQIMQISQIIGGFSLEEADNLRKAMGKKDLKKMGSMKNIFIEGAVKKGYDPTFAQDLFASMAKFAEYGFNKSHSAAYALISYQTAYLKAHYPLEYMACVLNAENTTIEQLAPYIKESKMLGLDILPPHINYSNIEFTVESKAIRFGFSAIKNIGNYGLKIIEERNKQGIFTSLNNLMERLEMNKKAVESLCISGTLDSLIPNRATIIHHLEKIVQFSGVIQKEKQSGFHNLFGSENSSSEESHGLQLEEIEEFDQNTLSYQEKETLGFYAIGHPLEKYWKKLENRQDIQSILDIRDIKKNTTQDSSKNDSQYLKLFGRFTQEIIKTTKNGEKMATYLFEGLDGDVSLIVFPKTYEKLATKIQEKVPVIIICRPDFSKKELQVFLQDIEFLPNYSSGFLEKSMNTSPLYIPPVTVVIKLKEFVDSFHMNLLKQCFQQYAGKHPVILEFKENNDKIRIQVGQEFSIKKTDSCMKELKKMIFIDDVCTLI